MTTIVIPINRLHPNPDNPRIEAGDLTELAASVGAEGLLQPPRVRDASAEYGEGHYYIEAGYRRWTAARHRGFEALECVLAPSLRVGETALERNLIVGISENEHRKSLHPIELARAFNRLRTECGLTQEQIAKKTGFHPTKVNQCLAYMDLTPAMQQKMLDGTLSTVEATRLVRRHRAEQRKKKGQKKIGAEWEPDHFTPRHPLAKKAERMCDARSHNRRRRIGNIACGECWETLIREDQNIVVQTLFEERLEFEKERWLREHKVQQPEAATVINMPFRPA